MSLFAYQKPVNKLKEKSRAMKYYNMLWFISNQPTFIIHNLIKSLFVMYFLFSFYCGSTSI